MNSRKSAIAGLLLFTALQTPLVCYGESEAGLSASSEASISGNSEARSCASSQAQWARGSSEAGWGDASSQAQWGGSSESGFGGMGGGRYRYRRGRRWNNGQAPQLNSDPDYQNQAAAMLRIRQDQAQQAAHERQLQREPDSDFVRTYGSTTVPPAHVRGGIIDTYRRNNLRSYGQP